MSAHTPGPYTLTRGERATWAELSAPTWEGFARVVVRFQYDRKDCPEGVANARLLLAAPDLLSALRRLVDAGFARDVTMGDPISLLRAKAELAEAVKLGRAAIAAAEGREP